MQSSLLEDNKYAKALRSRHNFIPCDVLHDIRKKILQLRRCIEAEVSAKNISSCAEDANLIKTEMISGITLEAWHLVTTTWN
jgi:hypothetical protein